MTLRIAKKWFSAAVRFLFLSFIRKLRKEQKNPVYPVNPVEILSGLKTKPCVLSAEMLTKTVAERKMQLQVVRLDHPSFGEF
jgi:hypothetical protein